MGRTAGLWILALAGALLLVAADVRGTVLVERTLAELCARADRVDIGVVERRAFRAEGELGRTDTTLRVERTLKGAPRARLVVTQLGGERDGVATELVGDARLVPGERFVLLTWLAPDGRRYLVSMGLGALHVRGSWATQKVQAAFTDDTGVVRPGPLVRRVSITEVERAVHQDEP